MINRVANKLLYKYESFTETYEETLRQKLLQKGKKVLSDGQKFAVSYQLKQITRHRKDIQLFLAKNEIAVYQITCKAEVQINVDGVLLPPMKTDISFSEPERVISLVL